MSSDSELPLAVAAAPGKIILLGEHAVVYDRPAIAAPVWENQARAVVRAAAPGAGCTLYAQDTGEVVTVSMAAGAADHAQAAGIADHALSLVARHALLAAGFTQPPDWIVELSSEIPIASGLGSGTALSAALVKALFAAAGVVAPPQQVSALVYAGEQLYHGTPSGIDNSVVAFEQPIWFVKGERPEIFSPGAPLHIAIADSGVPSPTKETVAGVRRRWEAARGQIEDCFDQIAALVYDARQVMERGDPQRLGQLFDRNQALLEQIGVSTPQLEALISAARRAGALGAKLSGGGGGGNMIALVTPATAAAVQHALHAADARRVIVTVVAAHEQPHPL
jgi:mevalonate kinase